MAAPVVRARYARILDGETLWLALEPDAEVVTLRHAAGELTETTEPETGGLVSARVSLGPLADVPGQRLEVAVLADGVPVSWAGDPAPGPVRAAIPTRDRRWRWRVVAPGGTLGLVREAVDPGVVVSGFAARPDGVVVELADGRTLRVTATTSDDDLTVDGLPLVRAHDDLRRPNFAVALPEVADGVRLRWTPAARLTLTREVREVVPPSVTNGGSKSEESS